MKKIIKLTESDLTRIIKRVINEGESDNLIDMSKFYSTESDYKPFDDLLIKNNFEYLTKNDDMDLYLLKRGDYDVMVGIKESYDTNKIILLIHIITKRGERINYLENLYGKPGLKLSDNEKTKVTRLVKGAIEFGESKKMIKENHGDRFSTVSHYIDMLEDVLDNYDSIDCKNINKKYEHFYCENLSEYSREKIENVLHNLEREKIQLINSHFHDKLGN